MCSILLFEHEYQVKNEAVAYDIITHACFATLCTFTGFYEYQSMNINVQLIYNSSVKSDCLHLSFTNIK